MPETSQENMRDSNGEVTLLSFVIRLWKETSVAGEQRTIWRGHITPIPDGKRYYFANIDDLPEMLANLLKNPR